MDRTTFFSRVTVDGTPELDLLYNSMDRFTTARPVTEYRIVEEDQMRPDLISFKVYGSAEFWWVVMFFNEIYNPLMDIVVGNVLKIPNILDVYDFYKK